MSLGGCHRNGDERSGSRGGSESGRNSGREGGGSSLSNFHPGNGAYSPSNRSISSGRYGPSTRSVFDSLATGESHRWTSTVSSGGSVAAGGERAPTNSWNDPNFQPSFEPVATPIRQFGRQERIPIEPRPRTPTVSRYTSFGRQMRDGHLEAGKAIGAETGGQGTQSALRTRTTAANGPPEGRFGFGKARGMVPFGGFEPTPYSSPNGSRPHTPHGRPVAPHKSDQQIRAEKALAAVINDDGGRYSTDEEDEKKTSRSGGGSIRNENPPFARYNYFSERQEDYLSARPSLAQIDLLSESPNTSTEMTPQEDPEIRQEEVEEMGAKIIREIFADGKLREMLKKDFGYLHDDMKKYLDRSA